MKAHRVAVNDKINLWFTEHAMRGFLQDFIVRNN